MEINKFNFFSIGKKKKKYYYSVSENNLKHY